MKYDTFKSFETATQRTVWKTKIQPMFEAADRVHRCPSCGHKYLPSRKDHVYCSSACRQAAYRARDITRNKA